MGSGTRQPVAGPDVDELLRLVAEATAASARATVQVLKAVDLQLQNAILRAEMTKNRAEYTVTRLKRDIDRKEP